MPGLELKIPPLVVLVLAAILAWVLAAMPTPNWGPGAVIGAVLAVAGAAIAILAVVQFRRAATTVDPRDPDKSRQIVMTGLYSYSRNPMYLGMALMLAGWVIALGNMWAGLALPIFLEYLTHFQIGPEEKILHSRFGKPYAEYASRVRRWI